MKNKNAIWIGLASATIYISLSVFFDYVNDESSKKQIFYYIGFFVFYFLLGFGIGYLALKMKK